MSSPRVTVISIFYNAEAYFGEAIDSVLAQDFQDLELILVDDGSTDSSSAIAREYAARQPRRIRVLEHPGHGNRGMSATRNLGLSEARGEFVAFIDADDRWRPSKLTEQVELLDRLPRVDAVGGRVNYWASHSGGKDRLVPTGHVRNRPIPPGEATLRMYPLGKAHAPSMSDLLFRRSSVEAVRGFEERFRGAYEDQAFLSKYYLESTLYFSDAIWSDYRLHESSCMAEVQQRGTYEDVRRSFLSWFNRHVTNSRHKDDPKIRRALARALRPYERRSVRSGLKAVPFLVPAVRAGKSTLRRMRPILAPGPAILMYHRIAYESFDPWGLAVSPEHFGEHLEWVASNRTPLALHEFAKLHRSGSLPRDAIAITFDDGYACNADVAQPILERFGLPATIFLPAELVEKGSEFWWDELERIIMRHERDHLWLDGSEVYVGLLEPDESWQFGEEPRTDRQRAYRELWTRLYARAPDGLDSVMKQLREQANLTESPRESHRPLSPSEVRDLRSELIEFGSHALTHASLPALSSADKAREIKLSIERCADLAGSKPRTFAYPYGDFDREAARLVEDAGYLCACRADGGFVRRRTSPFELPRIFVENSGADQLARQLGRP